LHQNAEKWHKKRRVKGYLWANCSLEMKNGLVAFGWAFSCAQCPKYMLKRPYFVPYFLQTPVNQSVINLKIRAEFRPMLGDFAARALIMLKGGANILHSRDNCSAPRHGLSA